MNDHFGPALDDSPLNSVKIFEPGEIAGVREVDRAPHQSDDLSAEAVKSGTEMAPDKTACAGD
jgi:hypothetical protein